MENQVGKGPFNADDDHVNCGYFIMAQLRIDDKRCCHHLHQQHGADHEFGNVVF